jgi:diketogulonate reductase-like aldo/keto reductase
VPPVQVALAWLLAKPAVTSVIVGARNESQLSENLKAAVLRLSEEEMSRLDEVGAQPLRYPYWHQAANASERLGPADLSFLARHVAT